ncbi:MAG: hypothetical protein E5Y01_16185 [Mesorhizobium sp.]|uniref:hypothetical protein n=1 Tax=Mesorhizobium sp. TaxID=1871066 RepID=UPI0011F4CB43|nr:hypothetical protein [Mesorhizobium sp.]TJV51126.1 MAG: hypothetical protein E5Y01_16185 [Mesorhizobium sp.]
MPAVGPGSLVVCVFNKFVDLSGIAPRGVVMPRTGTVYTVRDFDPMAAKYGTTRAYIHLVEIVNRPWDTRWGVHEPSFDLAAFKPVDDSRLEIFRKMLTPVDRVPA